MLLSISPRTARAPALIASLALLAMAMPMLITEIGGGALTCGTSRPAPGPAPPGLPATSGLPAPSGDTGPGIGLPPGGASSAGDGTGPEPGAGPLGDRPAGISPAVSLWLDGIGTMSGGPELTEGRPGGDAEAGAAPPARSIRRPRSSGPARIRSAGPGPVRGGPVRAGSAPSASTGPGRDAAVPGPPGGDPVDGGSVVRTESNAPSADDGSGDEE